jgi:hypothetical protein
VNKSIFVAAALALSTIPGSAGADTLPTRAASALGIVIATQGNAALVQIRRELQQSALRTIESFLPQAGDSEASDAKPGATESSDARAPAETPLSQRLL